MTNIIADKGREGALWKWITYSIYAYFITFPFVMYNSFLYGGSSTRSVNLVVLSIILGISFVVWVFHEKSVLSVPRSPIVLVVLAYVLFMAISGIMGLDPHTSFWSAATRTTGIWYFIHLVLFAGILSGVISDRTIHRRLILMIVLSTAAYSVLAFLGPEGIDVLFQDRLGDGFTFGNSSFAGMYILGAFVLSLYYIFQAQVKKWWMFLMPGLLVINPFIVNKDVWYGVWSGDIVGEARSSAYALIIVVMLLVLFWLVSWIKGRWRSIIAYGIFGFALVGIGISAWSLFSHDGYLRQTYLSQATAARPLIWDMSEKVIAQRPLLGWGTDTFERVFELNYDNKLLQEEYGNEAWFDRAHNVFIDQIIDNGIVGTTLYILMYISIAACLVFVALKSSDKSDRVLAVFVMVYFIAHLAELQTAFDTSISYPLVAFMAISAVILFHRTRCAVYGSDQSYRLNDTIKYILGLMVSVFLFWSLIWGLVPFVRAQIANGSVRTAGTSDKRIVLYPILFGSMIDEHSFLWRTSTDLQRGIGQNPKVLELPQNIDGLKRETAFLESEYKKYIQVNQGHYRAHLNLADILIYQRLFGVDKLAQAQDILDTAIDLVPQAPQAYWMKAVAYVYMKKFDLARVYARKAYELNPSIKQSATVIEYIETSIKNFPEIELFFFKQI